MIISVVIVIVFITVVIMTFFVSVVTMPMMVVMSVSTFLLDNNHIKIR